MKPHILVTEPEYFTAASLNLMNKVGAVNARRFAYSELLDAMPKVNALVVRIETPVDKQLLRRAKNLECVATATTGLDHIDTAALRKFKIPLFALHGEHSVPTAEHALALLLASARNIPSAHREMFSGGWRRWQYIGVELQGKTLGIFGIGRIGRAVARRAKAFGLKILACDPYLPEKEVARRGAKKVDFKTLLKKCDFISLHAPLTHETRACFNEKTFKLVKPSVILINTARGLIINERDLFKALKRKQIRAAALDVYPEEPLPAKHPLRRYARVHNNLLLTPHLGGSTFEAVERASLETAKNVVKFFNPALAVD